MREPKYKLIQSGSQNTLFRVVYLKDVYSPNGKLLASAGELGGFVEYEKNLSQKGSCVVLRDAIVMGEKTRVCQNAIVTDNAIVSSGSTIAGDAKVSGNAVVSDKSIVTDNAIADGYAKITNKSILLDNACVDENATLDHAFAMWNSRVYGNAVVKLKSKIGGLAHIFDNALVSGSDVYGLTHIGGHTQLVACNVDGEVKLISGMFYSKHISTRSDCNELKNESEREL